MSRPLEGVRILELGQIIAGTYGGQVLTDLGAEVIKIEAPEGDLGRIPSVAPYKGVSTLFLTFNRNKKSVVINLKSEAGRALFHDLVKLADVVIDNFRSGVLERLPLADLCGGIFSCEGILAALYQRERTDRGCRIETSMFDGMLNLLSYMGTHYLCTGEVPQPQGSAHEFTVPWQAFRAKDGYIVIATRQENFWRKLCAVLGQPALAEDPRFATNPKRLENRAVLISTAHSPSRRLPSAR